MSLRVCAFGKLGWGKTLAVVIEAMAYHEANPDLPIYSNIPLLTVPYRKIDSAVVLFDINEACFLLLDELWHLADSRRSFLMVNDIVTALLIRSRKKKWVVGYTEQFITQTDLRIRYITDYWIAPSMKGDILKEDIYTVDPLTGETVFIRSKKYDGSLFFHDYDHEADPFTLNMTELKRMWHKFQRDRGAE
jgi:hypothetical protein